MCLLPLFLYCFYCLNFNPLLSPSCFSSSSSSSSSHLVIRFPGIFPYPHVVFPGAETTAKLTKLKVIIVGLRGVGVETAKNLSLQGVGAITLVDPTPVAIHDVGVNFFIHETDIAGVRCGPLPIKVTVHLHRTDMSSWNVCHMLLPSLFLCFSRFFLFPLSNRASLVPRWCCLGFKS
jgi:hypothetical protein